MSDDSERDANLRTGVIVAAGLGLTVLTISEPVMGGVVMALLPALERGMALTQRRLAPHRLERVGATLVASGLLEGDVEFDVAIVEDEEAFATQVLEAAIADDEKRKTWAYGALLRAFHDSVANVEERAKWVALVRQSFCDDLVRLVNMAQPAILSMSIVRDDAQRRKWLATLARHGFQKDENWWPAEGVRRTTTAMTKHLAARMAEFEFTDGGGFTPDFAERLFPALLAGAQRAGLAGPQITEEDFLDLVLREGAAS